MDCKRDACLMINPRTGAAKLVEQPKEPEQIVKAFVRQAKKPHSLLWAMDQLVYEDWQKWEPVRWKLWEMFEELNKLEY